MQPKIVLSAFAFAAISCVAAVPISGPEAQYHQYRHAAEAIQEEVKKQIPIVSQNFEKHHGGYKHSFESGNGIHVQEQGYIKNKGDKKHESLVQQGTITYHDEHGNPITLTYIADEHGFQPQGAHLPTPPPIPAELVKAHEEAAQQQHQQPEPAAQEIAQRFYQSEYQPQYQQPQYHAPQQQQQQHQQY